MSAQVQNLVLDTFLSILIQLLSIMLESLPLCLFASIFEGVIGRVRLLNESKVLLCLIIRFVSTECDFEKAEIRQTQVRAYIFKGISISILKTLLEDIWQHAELVFGVWRRKSDCRHGCC